MNDTAQPRAGGIAAAERVVPVDALRGLALLGILVANINYWSGWLFMDRAQRMAIAGADMTAWWFFLEKFVVDGKFYTLFSMLFGIGFTLQLTRLEARGADGVRLFRRRLLVLLGFGLVHLMLVWDGDILTLYALLGMMLPWFRHVRSSRLLFFALALLLLPVPGAWAFAALGWHPESVFVTLSDTIAANLGANIRDPISWLQRRDAMAFFSWTWSGWPYRIAYLIESWRIPKVLGIMLIGMVLGRRLVKGDLIGDRRLFGWTLAIGLLIGVPASWAYATSDGADQASIAAVIGTVPLAFAYAAAFMLAWPRASALLGILAAPGRMALTNYLSHTALGIGIFYGIGLGLTGRVAPLHFLGIALTIYAAQVVVSHLWLARFERGPMEALWRRLTYRSAREATP